MKKQLICSLRKDMIECIRKKKNLLFGSTLFLLCLTVFLATKIFPTLLNTLINKASYAISNIDIITSTLLAFFPENLKANMGVLSSDIIIFYGIVVVLSTYNLIVKEIKNGKWVFPLIVGYKPFVLIISKGIIYGVSSAFPCIIFYNLYYIIGNVYLISDYSIMVALINSLVLGLAMFVVVYITIMLSTIYRQSIMSVVTIIPFVAVAPDVFSLFEFGKYLPTHMFTFLYQTKNNYMELITPILITILLMIFLTKLASEKSLNIEAYR